MTRSFPSKARSPRHSEPEKDDLAEYYPSNQPLDFGDIVVADAKDFGVVEVSTGTYQKELIGIVSTQPGEIIGKWEPGHYPIALTGRVPAKVSLENGPIEVGDPITSSSIPGVGMKATETGLVVDFR